VLEQHGAESGFRFLRSSDAELQPGDPEPDFGIAGIFGDDSLENGERLTVCPDRASCSARFRSVDGDWDVKDRTSAVARAISMAALISGRAVARPAEPILR